MPRYSTVEILRSGRLEDHPAIKSWRVLQPNRVELQGLEIVQETNKSGVYRIAGAGIGGSAVIAKQYRYENALVERIVYEMILPQLPLARLHYYGFVPSDDECHWIFIEDAGRERYSPKSEEQRLIAANWLGVMHTSAARVAAARQLPDRGSHHYLARLQSAHAVIQRVLVDFTLEEEDRKILDSVASQCDWLGSYWGQVEQACGSLPRTIVHGDFVRKNLPVRTSPAGMVLLPLDWETAGWGLPAIDLVTAGLAPFTDGLSALSASPAMTVYRSVVSQFWPRCGDHDLAVLTNLGMIFRLIDSVKWACEGLGGERTARVLPLSVAQFRLYQGGMARAIQAVRAGELKP